MPEKSGHEYAWEGRIYRTERQESGRWYGVGRARGRGVHVLDKIGGEKDQFSMQTKLDAWARRQGLRPLEPVVNQGLQMTLGETAR